MILGQSGDVHVTKNLQRCPGILLSNLSGAGFLNVKDDATVTCVVSLDIG